ncbi:hydantoinase B/oxoprolinase family protein, partial [Streptosporangium sp. H16]|uniref:hydantoinase B/oxoprolinase family protein n=1 Tax=Streptosporangium sp. H16 TaxID=3444184 RepID=UPI003F7A9664
MTERLDGGRQDDGNPDGTRTDGAQQEGARLDGATAEVVRSYLLAAAEEMRATLIRTSFNPVIYEVHDFGMSMYDADLRLIAEATGLTFFLGANDFSLRKGVEYVGRENLCPGDVVLLNYPYWNAAHS